MCSGKTTVGRKISRRLNRQFFDLDKCFEQKYKISVFDFFSKYDEKLFRRLESKLFVELAKKENAVIATGGGTPCFANGMDIIKKRGVSVYLKLDAISLLTRITEARKKRPLLYPIGKGDLLHFITTQLNSREPCYQRADLTLDGADVDLKKIVDFVKSRENSNESVINL